MLMVFLIMLGVLSFAAIAAYLIQHDEGFILVSLGTHSIEVRFWFGVFVALFALVIVYGCFRLLRKGIIAIGVSLKWWSAARFSRTQKNTQLGLIHFVQGNFNAAKKELTYAAKNSNNPFVLQIAAAQSELALNHPQHAKDLFNQAKTSADPKDTLFVEFGLARCDFELNNMAQCISTLETLYNQKKNNIQLQEWLCKAYIKNQQFSDVIALLPTLKKHPNIDNHEYNSIMLNAYSSQLDQYIQNKKTNNAYANTLFSFWAILPASLQRNKNLATIFFTELKNENRLDEAELLLSKAITKEYSPILIMLFANIASSDANKQLAFAQKLLSKHKNDAALLFALGKIAARNTLFGQAKDYIEESIAIKPNIEACIFLSKMYKELNEFDKEHACLQKSIMLIDKQRGNL